MAGGIGEAFTAQTFAYLLSEEFISKLTTQTCKAGIFAFIFIFQ